MKCAACAADLDADSAFCFRCGARVARGGARSTSPAVPRPRSDDASAPSGGAARRSPRGGLGSAAFVTALVVLAIGELAAIVFLVRRPDPAVAPSREIRTARQAGARGPGDSQDFDLARSGDAAALQRAIAQAEKEYARDPMDLRALRELAALNVLREGPAAGAGLLQVAILAAKDLPPQEMADLLNDAAVASAAAGDVVRAEVLLSQAIGRDGRHARALSNRGVLRLAAGRLEEARRDLEAALAADPDLVAARVALADSLWRLGELDAARAELAKALRADPNHAPARVLEGVLAEDSGRLADALAANQAADRALPGDPVIAANLERLSRAAAPQR